jgi:hypothetical protein
MIHHLETTHGNKPVTRRALHLYDTQRAKQRFGSGIASVDIQAWLLIAAMAFLLRDDPYASLPPQVERAASQASTAFATHSAMPACEPVSTFAPFRPAMIRESGI